MLPARLAQRTSRPVGCSSSRFPRRLCQWLRVISCQYLTSRSPAGTLLPLLLLLVAAVPWLSRLLVLPMLPVLLMVSPAAAARSAVRRPELLLLVVRLPLLPRLLCELLLVLLLPPLLLLLRFLVVGLKKP